MASAKGSGRSTPAQLEIDEKKRAKKARRLARKTRRTQSLSTKSDQIKIDA